MAMNTELADRVLDRVDADQLDMNSWVESQGVYVDLKYGYRVPAEALCGTKACLAGWTVIEYLRLNDTDFERSRVAGLLSVDGWSATARELLGVERHSAEWAWLDAVFLNMTDEGALAAFRDMFGLTDPRQTDHTDTDTPTGH